MKNLRSLLMPALAFIFVLFSACNNKTADNTIEKSRVLVIAGGHSFDTTEFVALFSGMKSITFDTLMQPNANRMIAKNLVMDYDVFVFYDMWPDVDSSGKEGYLQLLNQGKGFVFLHHSICSYQGWDEFKEIIGGKYYTDWSGAPDSMMSTFKHDIELEVHVTDKEQTVTTGLSDFIIKDEGYGNVEVNDSVDVILSAEHPECSGPVGWVNNYDNSKIIYIMLGHDALSYGNENFQKILQNAIAYVSVEAAIP